MNAFGQILPIGGKEILWTIVGLLIATAVSIEGAVSSQRSHALKLFVMALALAGSIIAGVSAYLESSSKNRVEGQLTEANHQLTSANKQLEAQARLLELVNGTVGDLGTLNRLSDGEKY